MGRLGAVGVALMVTGSAVGQSPAGDLGAVQGNWKPLSVQFEDKPQMSANDMVKVTGVYDHAEYHLYWADKSVSPPKVLKLSVTTVAFDESTSPKSVAITLTGKLAGQKLHGIYELAGNQLKLCYGPADKPKPTTFAAPPGSGYYLEVWARQVK